MDRSEAFFPWALTILSPRGAGSCVSCEHNLLAKLPTVGYSELRKGSDHYSRSG